MYTTDAMHRTSSCSDNQKSWQGKAASSLSCICPRVLRGLSSHVSPLVWKASSESVW